jgi:hypothetical protein
VTAFGETTSELGALGRRPGRFLVSGGFAILDLSDMAEALELCRNYAAILGGTLEIDVRVVDPLATPLEPSDSGLVSPARGPERARERRRAVHGGVATNTQPAKPSFAPDSRHDGWTRVC